jgi:type I restriction enzyme S subunit
MVMENRYNKYKDSGIAWIGEIPEHWDKNKIIRLFSIIGSGTTPKSSKEDNYIGSVNWIQSGDINGGYIENCKNTISDTALKEYPTLKIYKAPFIIVAMYGASVGNISISNIDGCVNQACCVMNETKQNFKYLFYAMNSVKRYLIYKAEGGGQPNISQDKIKNTWMPIPPFEEQQSIATYLDQKCGEIDELITLQEEIITKLQSYKQSVITEAVTKGLDKNVPLKDSGIEWIGKIPEHWNTYQLKRCSKFINGYAFNSNHFNKDKGIPVIRIGDILNEQISFENIVYVQENNELEKFIVHKNDILIAMSGATVGKIGVYNSDDKVYINQRVGIIRTTQYNYIKRMFSTNGFIDYINLSSAGSAQPNISSDGILNFHIPVPPLNEQQTIANYLDQKCSEIDELISIKQQKIEKLKDYKKSLIFECVTGKRKV